MKIPSAITFFVLTALLALPAAQAQATRTWVSGAGNDLNPCTRLSPCQTFARAITVTAAGGEISVLDSGGFGAVTINKAITIDGRGALASILASGLGVSAITVNAGANDQVVLRHLSLHGSGTASSGIRFLAGKSLLVEDVDINAFVNRGIEMSTAVTARMNVRNGSITDVPTGVFVTTANGFLAQVAIDNLHLTGLTNGLEGAANSRVVISNSVISGNASNGVLASSATSRVTVEGCQITYNNVAGVNASVAGSIIRISNNEIYENNAGVAMAAGATVESTGNSRDHGNISTTFYNAGIARN
jgi:hypothetical protein